MNNSSLILLDFNVRLKWTIDRNIDIFSVDNPDFLTDYAKLRNDVIHYERFTMQAKASMRKCP